MMNGNPYVLDFSGLNQGIDSLFQGMRTSRELDQRKSALEALQSLFDPSRTVSDVQYQPGSVGAAPPSASEFSDPAQSFVGMLARGKDVPMQGNDMAPAAPVIPQPNMKPQIDKVWRKPSPAEMMTGLLGVEKQYPLAAPQVIQSVAATNQLVQGMQQQVREDNLRRIVSSDPNATDADKAFVATYPHEYLQAKMQGLNTAKIWADIQHTMSGTLKNQAETKKTEIENSPVATETDANGTITQTQPITGKKTVVNPNHERAVAQSLSPTKVLQPDGTYIEGVMDKRTGAFRAGTNGDGPIMTGINKIPEAENAKLISNAAVRNDMMQVLDPANKADIIAITGILNGSGLTKLKSMIDSGEGGLTERQKYLGSKMLDAQQRYEYSATGASGNTDLRVKSLMDNLNNKMTYESLMGGYKAGQDSLYKVLEETVKNAQTNRQAVPSEYVDELQKIGRLAPKSATPTDNNPAQGGNIPAAPPAAINALKLWSRGSNAAQAKADFKAKYGYLPEGY